MTSYFDLGGKRALVTGAGRGIGRAVALAMAAAGADIALNARGRDALESVAAEIRGLGRRALVLPGDVGDAAMVRSIFGTLETEWGGLDIFVSNAGMNIRKPLLELADEDWHAVLRTNLHAVFYGCREAVRLMKDAGGRIVVLGSVAGLVAIPTGIAYAAAKAGLAQMVKNLALEWGPHGITANCIAPWYIRTALTEKLLGDPAFMRDIMRVTPLGRVGDVDDVAGVAVFLASRAAAYITGQTIAVDGGMTVHGFSREA